MQPVTRRKDTRGQFVVGKSGEVDNTGKRESVDGGWQE